MTKYEELAAKGKAAYEKFGRQAASSQAPAAAATAQAVSVLRPSAPGNTRSEGSHAMNFASAVRPPLRLAARTGSFGDPNVGLGQMYPYSPEGTILATDGLALLSNIRLRVCEYHRAIAHAIETAPSAQTGEITPVSGVPTILAPMALSVEYIWGFLVVCYPVNTQQGSYRLDMNMDTTSFLAPGGMDLPNPFGSIDLSVRGSAASSIINTGYTYVPIAGQGKSLNFTGGLTSMINDPSVLMNGGLGNATLTLKGENVSVDIIPVLPIPPVTAMAVDAYTADGCFQSNFGALLIESYKKGGGFS